LNLPKKDGHEVLADIKTDQTLNTIPVVILTSSAADEDIERMYYQRANAYVVKPIGLDEFMSVVQSIEKFWVEVAKLPAGDVE
jgi:two-component system, chemotaxis family, response regulator Rcp1